MSVAAMDPNAVRIQSNESRKSVSASDVAAAVGSSNSFASTMVGLETGEYKPAAVTSAAISGTTQAINTANTTNNNPYFYGASSGLSTMSAGPGHVSTASPFPPDGIDPFGVPGGVAPTQDYLEKTAILEATKDANWEMLVLQVTVNEISRDYQARSNILKTKSDTELNAVRNMRA